jgi:hypothetical protein
MEFRFMKSASSSLLLLLAVVAGLQTAHATTVIPPSFDQLVGQADAIFQGSVTDVRSQWVGEGSQKQIVSYVTFKVEDSLKGDTGGSYTIRMYGGTVGEDSMGISDAPTFKVGDRDIVFVENNGSQAIPLVGIMYGRFHVQKDQSGQDVVTRNEGEPLKNVTSLGREMNEATAANPAEANMTADAFKAAVKGKLQTAP